MKASDLALIDEPFTRFIQSTKFLRSLQESEKLAIKIRDMTLLELRKNMSQRELAESVGVSQQLISKLEKNARNKQWEPHDQ